jgi:type I restriction enzyme M protein
VKVAETLQDYSLSTSSIDVKGRAFQKVLWPSARAGMGQYFTPHEIVEFLVAVVAPGPGDRVLDPFAGSGHFLTRSMDAMNSKGHAPSRGRTASHDLHGIEKSDRMVRVALTGLRLHGDGRTDIRCADALTDFSNYPDLGPGSIDVILTNPPFGCLLGTDAVARLGRFELAAGRNNVPLEVLGLERCIQFLRPGGRLGIVLPDGILVNRATRYVRSWLEARAKVRALVSLPIETFAPYGAGIKTSVLVVRKWRANEGRPADYEVHLSRIDHVGYDASGRFREGSELDSAAGEIRAFLEREGW